MANQKECDHVGLDPAIVERFERRIKRLLNDMDKYELSIFCGSSGTIRHSNIENHRHLIVGDILAHNHDGGCGACCEADDGLLRGE